MKLDDFKEITIYTDGACSGNPGPGGWAAILIYNGHEKEISGYEENTTNNKMELRAVLEGLKALKEKCRVTIYTDSAYIVNAFQQGWIRNWKRSGWINSKRKPVENQSLWKAIDELTEVHYVDFKKVEGHAGNEYNERCDKLAVTQYASHKNA